MNHIDVFNGDADGICALHQLRLQSPRPGARLVTGVKRDIRLLARLDQVHDSEITVLDISLDRNREALVRLLARGNRVLYVDHHHCGEIPASPLLTTHIDPSPQICTSLIVDSLVRGRYRAWAVVGAFGDNLDETARAAARGLDIGEEEIAALRETGILLNYNGYGAELEDLFYPPDTLYRAVHEFEDPLEFHARSAALERLRDGYRRDMARAGSYQPLREDPGSRVFRLPGEPWARRVSGVFSNILARQEPARAHALLMPNRDGSWRISVRAPIRNRTGADQLCRRFPTGGGRAAAAGINRLPPEMLDAFLAAFRDQYAQQPPPSSAPT
ncbi:acetyltransferase [Thermodesulfobacteriota bacterium B35]